MSFYGSFSARAKRTIFLAHSQALTEDVREITPEHILSALLKEDPNLFALFLPDQTNSVSEIERLLAASRTGTTKKSTGVKPVLSPDAKEVVFMASQEQKRLRHKSVGTQHLLMALLVTQWRRPRWFRTRVRRNNSVAKIILEKCGLNARSVEQRIKEGVVTPLTWVLDDSIIKLNAQLTAVAELLISKHVFTRTEFVALLDKNADPVKPEDFLAPLIEALCEKGKLTATEKEVLKPQTDVAPSQEAGADEVGTPSADAGSSGELPTPD
jgi:ATP-dependent Clp protease ATP-binding subunit ClpA